MIEINPARIVFSQNNGMVSGHLLHCVYRDSALLIQLRVLISLSSHMVMNFWKI